MAKRKIKEGYYVVCSLGDAPVLDGYERTHIEFPTLEQARSVAKSLLKDRIEAGHGEGDNYKVTIIQTSWC
jgi:hypothetical protein